MAYQVNKPQAADKLSVSQVDIQGNFQSSNTTFGINHVDFTNTTSISGYHKVIQQVTQGADPVTIPGVNQVYSKIYTPVTAGGVPDTQLFTKTGLGGVSQLTGFLATGDGWMWTSGMLIQWGIKTMSFFSSGQARGNVTFLNRVPGAVAFPNSCFVVIPTLLSEIPNNSSDNTLSIVNYSSGGLNPVSKNGFSYLFEGSNSTNFTKFFWVAIGI